VVAVGLAEDAAAEDAGDVEEVDVVAISTRYEYPGDSGCTRELIEPRRSNHCCIQVVLVPLHEKTTNVYVSSPKDKNTSVNIVDTILNHTIVVRPSGYNRVDPSKTTPIVRQSISDASLSPPLRSGSDPVLAPR
jgi:hypothetical protein